MVKGPAPFDQGIFLMHLSKGKEYFDKGEFQKAREELEAAYHLRPQDEKVLNFLGMTYFKMEMLPQAEEMYVALAANNPDIYTLQSNLGLIRLKLEKLEQAETALSRALELQPANPKAHFYLGLLYEKLENWEKALFHFDHAKADKMVAKAREKLAERAGRMVTMEVVRGGAALLPFQVLEVLQDEEEIVEEPLETVLAPEGLQGPGAAAPPPAQPPEAQEEALRISDQEIAAAESEWVEHAHTTGKMRRKDVLEAMQRLEEKEVVEEEPEEELIEDSENPAVMEEVVEEELVEHEVVTPEKPWEKTQPTLRSRETIEDDRTVVEASPVLTGTPGVDFLGAGSSAEGLFLPEETAADISAFLAQSRREEEQEEAIDDFISEPPGQPSVVIAGEPAVVEEEPVVFEPGFRLPTPDEIENAPHDVASESVFVKEEEPSASAEMITEEAEEAGESTPHQESSLFESPFEEEAEESEMAQPFAGIAESVAAGSAPVEVMDRVEQTVEMAPAVEEQKPAMPVGVEPAGAAVVAREAAAVESLQPANLDQFSRDRFYIQPLIGADRFLLIDPHLLEIIISDRMIVRKGTISSFTGNVTFTSWADEKMPLTEVTGSGILFLADRRKEIFIISLNNESIYVESNHLLVAQSALKVEPFSLQHGDDVFSTVKVSGRGTIALSCSTKPLTLNVYEAMPANIPAEALIAWSGRLQTEAIADENLYRVMLQPGETGTLLRFSGAGDVVVEQGSLWGDRRAKK